MIWQAALVNKVLGKNKKKTVNINSGIDLSDLQNTSFADLAKNNPYTQYNYTPGLWDNIGNLLGFRTGEDRYKEQMELLAKQYDTQLLSTAREEEYNNELNTAARMRAAGLNPDLQGLGAGSEASEFAEPETNPEPAQDDTQMLQNFGGTIMSIINTGMSIASGLQGLQAGAVEITSKKLANEAAMQGNYNSYLTMARQWVLDFADKNPDMLYNKETGEQVRGITHNLDALFDKAEGEGEFYGMSSMEKRRFKNAVTRVYGSLPTTIEGYKKWAELERNRKEYAKYRASGYYRDEDTEMYEALQSIIQPLEKLDKENTSANIKAAQNKKQYEETYDPTQEAEALNAENKEVTDSKRVENEINKTWREIIDNLNKKADEGSNWAQAMLLAAMVLRNMTLQNNTSTRTNEKGEISENSGFSLGF